MSNPTPLLESPALTVRSTAFLLGTSELRVREMIARGTITGATKLTPGSDRSEWRIPRSSLDPWLGPYSPPAQVVEAFLSQADRRSAAPDPEPAPSGLSREALRARAGLDPEPSPGKRSVAPDTPTDTPSGSVAPVRPAPERQAVTLTATASPSSHPSETYVPTDERARREQLATATVVAREGADRARAATTYEGGEPEPFDGSTFGAGPAAE